MGLFGNNKGDIVGKDITKVSPKNANGYHCRTCKYFGEAGDGDYMCRHGEPTLIVENGYTTEDYFYCDGKYYESEDD